MFDDNFFENLEREIVDFPSEMGTEAVAQVKLKGDDSNNKKQDPSSGGLGNNQGDDPQRKQLLDDLYGNPNLSSDQLEQVKNRDNAIKRNMYQKIQQDIVQYRAVKAHEKTAYEKSWQKGTKAANTQQEEMELWEKEQKRLEEAKKKEDAITMPGSQQSRSGEQGTVYG
jgi:hypothetical protein